MMKRFWKICTAALLCVCLLSTSAFAFTFEELNNDEVFDPDLIEKEEVSPWAKSEIELARSAGLLTENTSFYMTRATTREQFAELIVNMVEKVTGESIKPASANTFTDCAAEAVLKAYAAGIVNGVGDGLFAPDNDTNRQEIATMIYRAIQYIKEQASTDLAPAAADLTGFTDKDQVASWALEGVGRLAANNIMRGTSDTELAPTASCTVEQCILLVLRVFQRA